MMSQTHKHSPSHHVPHGLIAVVLAAIVVCVQSAGSSGVTAHFLQRTQTGIVSTREAAKDPKRMIRTRVLRRSLLASARTQWTPPEQGIQGHVPTPPKATPRIRVAASSSHAHSSHSRTIERAQVAVSSASSSAAPIEPKESEPLHTAAPATQEPLFPAFERTVFPVSRTPKWGAMRTPEEWNRRYEELEREDFEAVPSYDLPRLALALDDLKRDLQNPENIRMITAKLFYSTRFFSAYDLDSGEFSGIHPGIDLKLAEGTPIGAIAGGKVYAVQRDDDGLGLHVIIEHRLQEDVFYSIYGHFESVRVDTGDAVVPGETIGLAGETGFATAPHLHLQIDRGIPGASVHAVYWPSSLPSRSEALRYTVHPIEFITRYRNGL